MNTKIIAIALLLTFMLSSCVMNTVVTMNANVKGAKIMVDGVDYDKAPVTVKLSNAVWEDPEIIVSKDGYNKLRTTVKKEVKVVNLIVGILLFWPSLLWCYGPKDMQNFVLTEE